MRCSRSQLLSAMFALAIVSAVPAFSQDPPNVAMGMSPQATYHSGDFDFVDVATGRLNLKIPLVVDHSQRGKLSFPYSLTYSSSGVWYEVCRLIYHGCRMEIDPPQYGLSGPMISFGALSGMTKQTFTNDSNGYLYEAWSVYEDGFGVGLSHPLGTTTGGMESIDGSGIFASYVLNCQGGTYTTTNRGGTQFLDNTSGTCSSPSTSWIEDANGNIAALGANNSFPINSTTDTLGRTWTMDASYSSDVTGCPTGGPVAPANSTFLSVGL